MNKYLSTYFGEIDLEAEEEWYEGEVELKGNIVTLDMYIHGAIKVDSIYIKAVDDFLDDLPDFEESIRIALRKDLKPKRMTYDYISILLDELEKEEIDELIKDTDRNLKKRERILSAVYLSRIGLYPEKEDMTIATFDYTLSSDLTDQLLVVNISKNREVQWITVES
jgi:hypothetical protein